MQVVVREQLGPQLGKKAIMDCIFPKGSVAELVGWQSFCADGEGSNPPGSTCHVGEEMISSLGNCLMISFC